MTELRPPGKPQDRISPGPEGEPSETEKAPQNAAQAEPVLGGEETVDWEFVARAPRAARSGRIKVRLRKKGIVQAMANQWMTLL